MSCLYSSPELLLVGLLDYLVPGWKSPGRGALMHTDPDAVQIRSDAADHRVQQKTRSPTASAHRRRTKSFTLPKQARSLAQGSCCVRLLLRNSSSAIQAFVHVAVESGTVMALEWTCVLEPFNRRACRLPGPICGASNPGPICWAERSLSGGIFQGVFLRSNRTLSGRFAGPDGTGDTRQIGPGRAWERQPGRRHQSFNLGRLPLSGLYNQSGAGRQ